MQPTYDDLLKENAELKAQLAIANQKIAKLEALVLELQSRLDRNSRNSSRPPSSDPLWLRRKPPTPPSGRKPGGQPGHPDHQRPLLPPDQVDEVVEIKPDRCSCGKRLHGQDRNPIRHQVADLPPIKPHWTEYQLHALTCPVCGKTTRAQLPAGVPTGAYGPRLQALVALCAGMYRMSKRITVGLLGDWLNLPMSLGSVTACEQQVSAALAGPTEEARAYVERQDAANVDETGWRQRRANPTSPVRTISRKYSGGFQSQGVVGQGGGCRKRDVVPTYPLEIASGEWDAPARNAGGSDVPSTQHGHEVRQDAHVLASRAIGAHGAKRSARNGRDAG